jgi:hypothetical protein
MKPADFNTKEEYITHVRSPRKYLISVLIPTRKRVDKLDKTIKNLIEMSNTSNNNYEIIVKVDFDDHEAIDYIKNWSNEIKNVNFIINSRLDGYFSLTDHYEVMVDCSKGKFMFGYNDDLTMVTKNWNDVLGEKLKETKVYFPLCNWAPDKNGFVNPFTDSFPIYPKKLKEIWGFVSQHDAIDNWMLWVSNSVSSWPWEEDCVERIPEVEVFHNQQEDEATEDKMNMYRMLEERRDYFGRNSAPYLHCINQFYELKKEEAYNNIKDLNAINSFFNSGLTRDEYFKFKEQ